MPIRFRCKYCNQLLGIARRKAGTDVSCPTCHGRLTVPAKDAPAPVAGAEADPPLFEQSDFEDFLRAPLGEEAARRSPSSRPRGGRLPPAAPLMIDVERLPDAGISASPPTGILITPALLTVLVVIVILLLATAFAAGIAVDRMVLFKSGS